MFWYNVESYHCIHYVGSCVPKNYMSRIVNAVYGVKFHEYNSNCTQTYNTVYFIYCTKTTRCVLTPELVNAT